MAGKLLARDARSEAARFLHDKVGQSLTAIGLQLDLARMDLASPSEPAAGRLSAAQAMLDTVMADVREYVRGAQPGARRKARVARRTKSR
jgi:signal transduction histidine kinase